MSERINVDHAFDPEARRAQTEFDAFVESRPYKDEKGDVHSPEDGRVVDNDAYHNAKRDGHYETSLAESDYSGESLEQLAQRVAQARIEGDKTRTKDAEDAFFDKFSQYSEKYGWEEEVIDESATEQMHVDDSAKLGRTTINDRLERYAKIMYGETSTGANDVNGDNTPEPDNAPESMGDKLGVTNTSEAPTGSKESTPSNNVENEAAGKQLADTEPNLEYKDLRVSEEGIDTPFTGSERDESAKVSVEGLETPVEQDQKNPEDSALASESTSANRIHAIGVTRNADEIRAMTEIAAARQATNAHAKSGDTIRDRFKTNDASESQNNDQVSSAKEKKSKIRGFFRGIGNRLRSLSFGRKSDKEVARPEDEVNRDGRANAAVINEVKSSTGELFTPFNESKEKMSDHAKNQARKAGSTLYDFFSWGERYIPAAQTKNAATVTKIDQRRDNDNSDNKRNAA